MRKCVCMIQGAGPARRLSSGSKSFVAVWVNRLDCYAATCDENHLFYSE
jgi:hypothetical protein